MAASNRIVAALCVGTRCRSAPSRCRAAALAALACSMAAACSPLGVAPRPSPGPEVAVPRTEPRAAEAPSARPQSDSARASQSLLRQSRAEREVGDYATATATIERALRIDPSNPALWLELGEIHLAAGNRAQAEAMARKALTLAGDDRALESQGERLLRAAASR
jgi:tetratricopeptide (TPR) repeat protein